MMKFQITQNMRASDILVAINQLKNIGNRKKKSYYKDVMFLLISSKTVQETGPELKQFEAEKEINR